MLCIVPWCVNSNTKQDTTPRIGDQTPTNKPLRRGSIVHLSVDLWFSSRPPDPLLSQGLSLSNPCVFHTAASFPILYQKKVESLAVQACRAVCWFHRCGLVHGNLTPDNFIVLGGTAGASSTTPCPMKGRGLAHTAGASTGRGGCGGCGKVGGAARWEGEVRLMVSRSVARRSDAAGGCPRHPLLEVCGQPCMYGTPCRRYP